MLALRHLLPLILLLPTSSAKFYIGRYKTAASNDVNARSLPYIIFPEEGLNEVETGGHQWLPDIPPPRRFSALEPPTRFGVFPSDYGNDPYNGYSLLDKDEVGFVVPPFTPGGRVNVAFQFWVPVTLGGSFSGGRGLQEAPLVPAGASSLLIRRLQSTNSTVETRRRRRRGLDGLKPRALSSSEGWVTIGGQSEHRPRAQLLNDHLKHRNRLLWGSNDVNDLQNEDYGGDDYRPNGPPRRPTTSPPRRPPLPSFDDPPRRPPLSSFDDPPRRPSSSTSSSPPRRPTLTSFDDLTSVEATSGGGRRGLDVTNRLSRLDYFFKSLRLQKEDCRRRLLCEVVRDPQTYAPLSQMVEDETRIPGDENAVSRELLTTAEGSRLLSYIEAVHMGTDRSRQCDVYRHRCRTRAGQVINTDILPIWREVVRWLTVKVLAKDASSPNAIF